MKTKLLIVATLGLASLALAMPTQPQGTTHEARSTSTSTVADQKIKTDTIDVNAWSDLRSLVNVLDNNPSFAVAEIRLDRDFKDYLVETVDRESMERINQEN